jgi:hypothetical protein
MRGNFGKVSLPESLHQEIEERARSEGRSLAKQIEHSFRIACAVEKLLPVDSVQQIKHGALPCVELLQALAQFAVTHPHAYGNAQRSTKSDQTKGNA